MDQNGKDGYDFRRNCYFLLTLVRHGETQSNRDKIIQGQLDVPLSEEGECQAIHAGMYLRDVAFNKAFVSDLKRTMQTAEIIKANSLKQFNIHQDVRLRERSYGQMEGKSFTILKDASEKAGIKLRDYTAQGGESLPEVRFRATQFFHNLCQSTLQMLKAEKQTREATNGSPTNSSRSRFYKWTRFDKGKTGSKSPDSPKEKYLGLAGRLDASACLGCWGKREKDKETKENQLVSTQRTKNGCETAGSPDSNREDYNPFYLTKSAAQSPNGENILIVSHGVLLKEMIRYFVEDLNCIIPGGKGKALRTSPNTGVSQFMVHIGDDGQVLQVECLMVHSIQHLPGAHKYCSAQSNGK
ncbi:fructose-2,6-bisphosphatase TIGAR-like [Anneissia japonica]|uniref:fructose-2,6-bisphosphatase TIGAR-like n=1 Tax=Anneissia japonica TaxID=1529436 RepID=UPI00142587D1|nr:fructose-2,6-bisphosphatase TIGAR-like [Anneissia japonica]